MEETKGRVLPLLYRPKVFEDVVGNEKVAKILKQSVASNNLKNAYFFAGERGCGKTSSARIFAKALLCKHTVDGNPCNCCQDCLDADAGKHPDLWEQDAASENSVQSIRDLINNLNYMPTSGKYKIIILDECHSLSKDASNALLKTLEEPPEYVKFIFCTTEPHKVLDTIRSRCLIFTFKSIQGRDIVKRLRFISDKEGILIDNRALEFISKYSNGGMRDAVMLLDQVSLIAGKDREIITQDVMDVVGFVSVKEIQDLFTKLKSGEPDDVINWLEVNKFAPYDVISSSISFLENLIFIKNGVSPSVFVSQDLIPSVMNLASLLTIKEITDVFNIFRDTVYDLRNLTGVNTSTVFIFKMLDVYNTLHNSTLPQAVSGQVLQVTVDPFQRLKEDFNLVRVPLAAIV